MKNVNDLITTKYFQLLKTAMPDVQVFRDYVPNDLQGNAYVLISAINSSDMPTMHSTGTETSIQVGIYTRSFTDNDAETMQTIATNVYAAIKPSFTSDIVLDEVQVLTTEFAGDNNTTFDTGSEIFINRFITFKHKIVHSLN